MIEEVGAFPHNLANCSPVSDGNLLFCSTGNGQDESHVNVPSPKAPSIIALDIESGKLKWEDNSVGENVLHGQWSTPAVGDIGGVRQVVHAQGDGWVRGYEATAGKKLWEFDTNPKDSVWPKTRNEVISTPVIFENVVYISNGQDPEHGEGVGHAYAIDGTKRGDITQDRHAVAFRQDPPLDFHRGDQGRHDLSRRLQRLPALPRCSRPASRSGRTTCSRRSGDRRS